MWEMMKHFLPMLWQLVSALRPEDETVQQSRDAAVYLEKQIIKIVYALVQVGEFDIRLNKTKDIL